MASIFTKKNNAVPSRRDNVARSNHSSPIAPSRKKEEAGGLGFMGRSPTAWAKRHDFSIFDFFAKKIQVEVEKAELRKAAGDGVLELGKGFKVLNTKCELHTISGS